MLAWKDKIVSYEQLTDLRKSNSDKRIVFTNGCFDVLHVGHARCLQYAREQGDMLVLGLNSDASVKRLKGPTRPINPENDRAEMLALYTFVDYIVIFNEDTPENAIRALHPDIWVKGGDWNTANLPGVELCRELNIQMTFFPSVIGKSSTNVINAGGANEETQPS